MNDFNIRITNRQGDTEQVIDIDCAAPAVLNGFEPRKLVELHSEPAAPKLEWSATLCKGERVKHAAAEKACAALGDGWRLPTRVELLSLVDDTRSDPAIDVERFPDTKSGAYWTGTPLASDSSCAWVVYFSYGAASSYHRGGSSAFVRAVRSVPAGQ